MKRAIPAAVLLLIAFAIWFLWPGTAGPNADGASSSESLAATSANHAAGRPDAGQNHAANTMARSGATDSGVGDAGAMGGDGGTERFRKDVEAWMKRNGSEAEQLVDRFCDENRKLKKSNLFPEHHGERDAAVFMMNRVDWEGGLRPPGSLHLPVALSKQLRDAGSTWPIAIGPAALTGLDFSWLRELRQYDTWSVAAFGPMRDDQPVPFAQSPVPNYMSLMEWAKLRFVLAYANHDFADADAEVRQLAALIDSQGMVLADSIAVAVLKIDAQARAAALSTGQDVSDWPPVDEDAAKMYRSVSLAGVYFFAPGVPEPVLKKARECMVNPCSAIAEGLGLQLSFAPYATDHTRAIVERYADESGCSSTLLERVRKSPPIEPSDDPVDGVVSTVRSYFPPN